MNFKARRVFFRADGVVFNSWRGEGVCKVEFSKDNVLSIESGELVEAISTAFFRMKKRDIDLFEANPQERAYMYRFAFELDKVFSKVQKRKKRGKVILSLDVEYNRSGNGLKLEDPENPETHKWIAPDIILHERRSEALENGLKNRNNIFAIEMKRNGREDNEDAARLKRMLEERKYLFAVDFYRFAKENSEFDLYQKIDGAIKKRKFRFNGEKFEENQK